MVMLSIVSHIHLITSFPITAEQIRVSVSLPDWSVWVESAGETEATTASWSGFFSE
jgi:hypothetical protein